MGWASGEAQLCPLPLPNLCVFTGLSVASWLAHPQGPPGIQDFPTPSLPPVQSKQAEGCLQGPFRPSWQRGLLNGARSRGPHGLSHRSSDCPSQDKIFRWSLQPLLPGGHARGKAVLRGRHRPQLSCPPHPPQANKISTDFYTGLEVPHQLPAAVLLTSRPTLHLLCPRPGCILRHSWTSLALSHRAPALGIQTCRSLTSKPVATPECPSRLADTVTSCNKCPLRTSSSPRLGQLTW